MWNISAVNNKNRSVTATVSLPFFDFEMLFVACVTLNEYFHSGSVQPKRSTARLLIISHILIG